MLETSAKKTSACASCCTKGDDFVQQLAQAEVFFALVSSIVQDWVKNDNILDVLMVVLLFVPPGVAILSELGLDRLLKVCKSALTSGSKPKVTGEKEGAAGFAQGIGATVAGYAIAGSLSFGLLELFSRGLREVVGPGNALFFGTVLIALSSVLATTVRATVVCPFEAVR